MKTKTSYAMQNEQRIIELLAESLKRQDRMVEELSTMRVEVHGLRDELHGLRDELHGLRDETTGELRKLNDRTTKITEELHGFRSETSEELRKLNLQTASNTRAIMDMAAKINVVVDHEHRITKLESIVTK